jgi:hypothetical protein
MFKSLAFLIITLFALGCIWECWYLLTRGKNLHDHIISLRREDWDHKTTETCKKYSVTVIIYYIFHIQPQFFKTLFQSQFLFDFDDIFTNRSENVCSFL